MTETYVAVRFPSSHVVFHMLFDKTTFSDKPDDAYRALSQLVQTSVREALSNMDIRVIETSEESIEPESLTYTVKACGWCLAPLAKYATSCDACGARFNG